MDLFVYGTLMLPEIMHAVSGCDAPGEPAVLADYRRRRVAGEAYPAIVEAAGETVEGLVYCGLGHRQLERLDRFEGEMYRRVRVGVTMSGVPRQAQAYVLQPQYRHRLTDRPWSLQDFAVQGLRRFVEQYQGFSALRETAEGRDRG